MEIHYLPSSALHGKGIFLEGEEAHHILRVKRHKSGDAVVFTDGTGRFLNTVIDRCSTKDLHARLESIRVDPREEGAPRLTLGLALLKGDHFELAVEKCVEMGVHRVLPVFSRRCVVQWKGGAAGAKKLARWQRIALSAMKQAGRSWMPTIEEPMGLDELHESEPSTTRWIVADETESSRGIEDLDLDVGGSALALVGPEGGFDDDEKRLLESWGADTITLSPFRLRAETAAVALVGSLARRMIADE